MLRAVADVERCFIVHGSMTSSVAKTPCLSVSDLDGLRPRFEVLPALKVQVGDNSPELDTQQHLQQYQGPKLRLLPYAVVLLPGRQSYSRLGFREPPSRKPLLTVRRGSLKLVTNW